MGRTVGEVKILDLIVCALAARRLTRIITKDEIAAPLREYVWKHEHKKLTYFVNCPYCVSVWAGLLVSTQATPSVIVRGLALSELVVLTRGKEL